MHRWGEPYGELLQFAAPHPAAFAYAIGASAPVALDHPSLRSFPVLIGALPQRRNLAAAPLKPASTQLAQQVQWNMQFGAAVAPPVAAFQAWAPVPVLASAAALVLVASVITHKMQESEKLERMTAAKNVPPLPADTDHVRLVSLGCMCGAKLSFQQLGRGSETLPFDWVRSRLKGILHFLRSDFEGYFDYDTMIPDCGGMTMFRSRYHSFWHDNPDDEDMREKYERRIARFKEIDASKQPVLFVRAVASTDELMLAVEVAEELARRFGEQAHLLLIVDFQKRMQGPAVVHNMKAGKLLLYYHATEDREPAFAPYMKPIRAGLDWAARKNIGAKEFTSMNEVLAMTDPTAWGYTAHGNVRSFENVQL